MKFYTKGINTSRLLGIGVVILGLIIILAWSQGITPAGVMSVVTDQPRVTTGPAEPRPSDVVSPPARAPESTAGVYRQYDASYVEALGPDDRIILFFTSVTCASCQRVEASILAGAQDIPPAVHILTVDFSSAPDLRRQYSVRTPHTFVEIRSDGSLLQSWTASRDLQAILARL